MTLYYQCELSQGTARTRGYIEERGAKVGAHIELKEDGFDGLWRVDSVADKGVEQEVMRDKQQRDRDSLPSVIGNKRPR